MNKTVNTPSTQQALDTPGAALKAERIQLEPVGQTRLKAERIQLVLRDLPGWRLQRGVNRIQRTYELSDSHQVSRLLQYVAELGYGGGNMPEIEVRGGEVTFRLPISRTGMIDEPLFDLAKALDVRS
jgi:pterin-4a-carbinolamine dehydratase